MVKLPQIYSIFLQGKRMKTLLEFDSPQIYCDMDGVLADFDNGIKDMIGGKFSDARWDELPDDFFLQLEPMKDAKKLWDFIGKYEQIYRQENPSQGTFLYILGYGLAELCWTAVGDLEEYFINRYWIRINKGHLLFTEHQKF